MQTVVACLAALAMTASGAVFEEELTCVRYEPGTTFPFRCWAADGLKDGEGALYVFLEYDAEKARQTLVPMMDDGRIPRGLCVCISSGTRKAGREGAADRRMRAEEFDQPGTEFPNALVEEIVPAAERRLGVRASRSPDLHFIAGASSGGIAAWNACWFRNDFFRRTYLNSPTFSNMRGGPALMQLVRKCEPRPIRVWVSAGTFEPDYFFGDSYLVACDAVGALRYAGYEVRHDTFPHEGHCTHWGKGDYTEKVLAWLFGDWRTKPVAACRGALRVRGLLAEGGWEPCDFRMPPSVREIRSVDDAYVYSVAPTNRFVMSERALPDGTRDQRAHHSPLELAWNVSAPGGKALALIEDDRLLVATELGVQGVSSFGLTDIVLPLPGDLPCDNVAVVGRTLYAASGDKVFRRLLRRGAAPVPRAPGAKPSTPGYSDDFVYSREHDPAGGIAGLIGSWVVSGRIYGAISIVRGADGTNRVDVAGWRVPNTVKRRRYLTAADAEAYLPKLDASGRHLEVFCDPAAEDEVRQLRRDWDYESRK